jgi:hypothetical protein
MLKSTGSNVRNYGFFYAIKRQDDVMYIKEIDLKSLKLNKAPVTIPQVANSGRTKTCLLNRRRTRRDERKAVLPMLACAGRVTGDVFSKRNQGVVFFFFQLCQTLLYGTD